MRSWPRFRQTVWGHGSEAGGPNPQDTGSQQSQDGQPKQKLRLERETERELTLLSGGGGGGGGGREQGDPVKRHLATNQARYKQQPAGSRGPLSGGIKCYRIETTNQGHLSQGMLQGAESTVHSKGNFPPPSTLTFHRGGQGSRRKGFILLPWTRKH